MRSPQAKIELHMAYVWDCDSCGRENFCRGAVLEFSEEDRAELREEHGVEEWESGEWMSAPEEVTCQHCGKEFEVDHA